VVALPVKRRLQSRLAAIVHSNATKRFGVLPGINVLAADNFVPLAGSRVGLVTNQAGRELAGRRSIDVLVSASSVQLVAIFSPEHGLDADREGDIESGRDAQTGLPVYSLYGAVRRPLNTMLAGVDGLVIDLQDVGARFYTYVTTMAYVMEEAARRRLKVVVLDRPNPIGPAGVRGPVLERDLCSFTGYFPMPVQHGMTLGELAIMFNAENHIGADLTVIPMRHYHRNLWYDETGLNWVNPSPNLKSLDATILYPGVALIEYANMSVGRGTPTPFELVGAPWIDHLIFASYLQGRQIGGVRFSPAEFTPVDDRYAGKPCHGVRILLADRAALNAPRLGIELAAALHRLYPDQVTIRDALHLIGSRDILVAIEAGEDPRAIESRWLPALQAFEAVRIKYLLY
jgi:uncharacterized protein YbbC (DUF1343 family)